MQLCRQDYPAIKGVSKLIFKLAIATIVYTIWGERNSRLHFNPGLPSHILSSIIINRVKCKLVSFAKFHRAKLVDSNPSCLGCLVCFV